MYPSLCKSSNWAPTSQTNWKLDFVGQTCWPSVFIQKGDHWLQGDGQKRTPPRPLYSMATPKRHNQKNSCNVNDIINALIYLMFHSTAYVLRLYVCFNFKKCGFVTSWHQAWDSLGTELRMEEASWMRQNVLMKQQEKQLPSEEKPRRSLGRKCTPCSCSITPTCPLRQQRSNCEGLMGSDMFAPFFGGALWQWMQWVYITGRPTFSWWEVHHCIGL